VTLTGAKAILVRQQLVATNLNIANSADPTAAIEIESTGELAINGGTITGGEVGILETSAAKVHLTNLLISKTRKRALELAQSIGELEFSTIVDSGAQTLAAPCSVACSTNLAVTSSIIFQEICSNQTRDAVGTCTFASSIVSNALPPSGTTNTDPKFVNRVGGDYHIRDTSPAKDAVDVGPPFDFEGDARPRGVKFDIGADEAP
jgi:hypothetical protein